MYPHLRSLVKQHDGEPFAVIGVNSDPLEVARCAIEEERLNWRSFWAGPKGVEGPIPTRWAIQGWPTLFLIGHDGVIRGRDLGGEQLDQAIAELIAAAKRK